MVGGKMFTKRDYLRLSAKWRQPIYQTYEETALRFKMAEPYLKIFTCRNVLEIGCNAALAAQPIMQYADSYIGLEPNLVYYEQALETWSALGNDRVWIYQTDFVSYLRTIDLVKLPFDALYLSNILYHLSDEELKMLEMIILPNCLSVIVLTRAKERRKLKNSHQMNRRENVWNMLERAGYQLVDDAHKGKNGPDYFITVGERDADISR